MISLGRTHYIFKYGMLYWGVPTGILFSIFQYFTKDDFAIGQAFLALLIFPIGGIFYGVWTWSSMIKKQEKQN